VFNELSLPFSTDENIVEKFIDLFKLLEEIKKKGLGTLRFSEDFKNYKILEGVYFKQFVGQQKDRDFQRKIRSFLANSIVLIESPLIKNKESEEQNIINGNEYFYNGKPTIDGLACCDVWNTLAVSFNSSSKWDNSQIRLEKNNISDGGNIISQPIYILHCSKIEHLITHQNFFDELQAEIKLRITQENFWIEKNNFFPNIIVFCPEVELQINKLDKKVFQQAISILRKVETQRKLIKDYNYSGESETVRNTPDLRKIREFTVKDEKVFFENHIKSLPNAYRIYFLEEQGKIYIGYIGKHLKGKRNK
ncbi:MAG: hypothetical protein KAU26_02500, partial [Methylococcales bacterium]|nr:hypothetical protein [Methylococcales bacterium]